MTTAKLPQLFAMALASYGSSERFATMHAKNNFPGLVGHAGVQSILKRAVEHDRLHHALIFVGSRGVGKTTLARGLACAMLCREVPAVGCGTCSICSRILKGIHPDCTLISASGKSQQITRESVHSCVLNCQHAPFEAPVHVVIVTPADRMTIEAANTLLKCLEEPPPQVYFILLATNESNVLPTLTSRCLSMPLRALDDQQVLDELQRRLTDEFNSGDQNRESMGTTSIELAVQLAQGSIGSALEYASNPSWACTRNLLEVAQKAVDTGPAAIFGGDHSELWQTWEQSVLSVEDPEETIPETDSTNAVIKVRKAGAKTKAKSATKKSRSTTNKKTSKSSPSRQRIAAMQLTDLWLLDLRKHMLDGSGLYPATPSLGETTGRYAYAQMRILTNVQESLHRNPNVRLTLEQMLLDMSAATA